MRTDFGIAAERLAMGRKRLLSTGQAAKMLSVSPDTVLKWVKSGRVPAQRTPGGHHRLRLEDVERLRRASGDRRFRFCWEFNSGNGELAAECRDCLAYVARAMRCYELAKRLPGRSLAGLCCETTCEECEYYRLVKGKAANVLVVSGEPEVVALLERQSPDAGFNLATADSEYAASALVQSFRPDFAVIDCGMGAERARSIADHLVEDPRLQLIRIILAGAPEEVPSGCDRPVFARMERPFDLDRIAECISEIRLAV